MKTCTHCKQTKDTVNFSPGSSWCKLCRASAMKERKQTLFILGKKAFDESRIKRRPEEKNMDPEDWELFWPAVTNLNYRLYFDLLQSLGLRAQEGLGLTPTDFDFNKGIVNIKPLKRDDNYSAHFPVRPDLITKLQSMGYPYFKFTYISAWRVFKKTVDQLGLNHRLRLHSLRHLYQTRLVLIDASEFDRAYMLRHKQKSQTNQYGYVPMARMKQLSAKLWEAQTWLWKKEST